MNRSKKGVTLVELVIACTIMVLLAGACTAVLVSGQRLFITGAQTATNQLEANLLQTSLLKSLPNVIGLEVKSIDAVLNDANADGVSIFMKPGDALTIRKNGVNMTVNNVKSFEYKFKRAGKEASYDADGDPTTPEVTTNTAKTRFVYTAELEDGTSITGGLVLTNIPYAEIGNMSGVLAELEAGSGSCGALYFAITEEETGS